MRFSKIALSLSAIALLSTTAANAQVERFSYNIGAGAPTVLTYPAVMDNTAAISSCGAQVGYGACGAPLFGRHTYWDNGLDADRGPGLLGGLLGLPGAVLGGIGGGLLGFGADRYAAPVAPIAYGMNSYSAVIPNTCGGAVGIAPACGQRLSNSVFDVRLFGLGLGFGRVNPRWDMRPAGSAL